MAPSLVSVRHSWRQQPLLPLFQALTKPSSRTRTTLFFFVPFIFNIKLSSTTSSMATSTVIEARLPTLSSSSDPPTLFDGTTRLYMSYSCPFSQRVWITRNVKGLQDKIQLVPLHLQERPAWYKEKVNPENSVPSLEHDGKIITESLDLIKYVNANFEGPALFPEEPAKKEAGEELLSYFGPFSGKVFSALKGDPAAAAGAFDHLETALGKFDDGPFFLGQLSLVDVAYAPFIERFQIAFSEILKHDITAGRPRLATWIEELNKYDAYKQTKIEPAEYVAYFKRRFLNNQ